MTAPVVKPTSTDKRVWPPNPWQAAFIVGGFTALLYLIEAIDAVLPADLDHVFGILPRSVSGLDGILLAPLLHFGWWHLNADAPLVLVLGFLAMAGGLRQWIAVTATIWLISGVGVWLISPADVYTAGVSGVTMGWFVFLLARGTFTRGAMQVSVAGALLLYWGSTLWLIFPTNPFFVGQALFVISWQAHLFGAVGGLLAMWLVAKANWLDRAKMWRRLTS